MNFAREIYEYGLPHRAVAVYMYLSNRANKNRECYPSVRTIAEDLHLSKSTVFRALNDLETAGLITREKRWRTSGGRSSTLYQLKEC
ncbi:MAG TPA: helix-turn-helix domain-containing protein [Oscillospiraceae bacterium]|uniref:helix-turn-helix domain-containing protein n=1 Tax=Clostridia TaxID=186801 RepID=UPI0023EF7703|nr:MULTISPECIES: helix-turn-helix domain-containing protein [Ruminococcus]MBS6595845.1 helix-turn-helix domain-containing protein [Ruminococcus callidus]MEE0143774.1 helix-turn-helix domain-containing protein [Ruminococcus sp.]MEE0506946.1 helix-turn-helix domain-containing protein [Ruminococcus callidus]HJH92860.1 helix-turn-helix domain-containing protein [Oscillospiraceae bacterium]